MGKKFDNISSGLAENHILGNQVKAVALLCAFSDRLFHDTVKGVYADTPDLTPRAKEYYDKDTEIDKACKNVKVRAIKKVANWLNFIAEAFEYIEDNRDDGYGGKKD